jgi:predicted GNAT superfamily acetyltransferase
LQRTIWGLNPEDLVPQSIFIVSSKIGGQILGAFAGTAHIGFSSALPAFKGDYRYLHSHMVGVLPSWRNRGVGRQLKLKQREEALNRGLN